MNLEFFFSTELILENESILLRPLSINDIDKIESISYNKELGEFGARVKNRNDLMDYFKFCLNSKKEKELYPLIIIRKEDNSPIGLTMFGNLSFQNKRLEIGWTWIGEKFQGTGINAICKELLLDYCFNTLNLRRVEFKIDIKNLKSQKAIEKIGAIKEGFLRNYNIQSYGESEGTYVYSILKEEWKN
ncbi:GNAT family N-acetyltransferase [Flavobacterium gawalongense]|uniref:GNAT family N-acetyltransferase n=1 Tax=Flavobacterium gawalongense TaxID=2594432 RepID=A0A553BFI0_9FLAO|nr:GNAT family protein [Flavobacterium gawalongense]TRW97132.1 GNAT family N-acetyltransferase [Flavobacterium gawalongense]TRX05340.1 GNAT family N-acetyltransferase [Flavobacterium gawalongense]TRX07009.1 GNAT family N-acetyltransferase [Flavobacterium gawalongense]TRX10329.1 GNAT family N-acetyltransferase [Flavobacterium gawalongense]TRX27663.1 GNAT family N-acetyltransferase [Flavobacterium gawalongense]